MLQDKYRANANNLAEALCDTGVVGEEARHDLKMIGHMQCTLVDWLPADSWIGTNLIAVVQEPGFDLIGQVNAALEWIVSESIGEGANFTLDKNSSTPVKFQHSSTSKGKRSQLSTLGTCCVARHLADDYKLLHNISPVVCRGNASDVCSAAISSILNRRRAMILEGNLSLCQLEWRNHGKFLQFIKQIHWSLNFCFNNTHLASRYGCWHRP